MNNIYSRIKTLIRHNHNRLKVAVKNKTIIPWNFIHKIPTYTSTSTCEWGTDETLSMRQDLIS